MLLPGEVVLLPGEVVLLPGEVVQLPGVVLPGVVVVVAASVLPASWRCLQGAQQQRFLYKAIHSKRTLYC